MEGSKHHPVVITLAKNIAVSAAPPAESSDIAWPLHVSKHIEPGVSHSTGLIPLPHLQIIIDN